jgi:peptidyl-prolyl cis-trans isomerase C
VVVVVVVVVVGTELRDLAQIGTSKTVLAIAIAAALASPWACRAPRIEDYSAASEASRVEPLGGASAPEAEEIVLAKVGADEITLGEFQRHLDAFSELGRAMVRTPASRRRLFDALVVVHQLSQEAERRGLASDPAVAAAGDEALRTAVEDRVVAAQLDGRSVSDADIEAAYQEQLERFQREPSVRLKVLVLGDRDTATELIEQIESQPNRFASEQLAEFEALVQAHSVDPESRRVGGDLGFLTRDQLAQAGSQEMAEAAFDLQNAGDIIGPYRTAGGWVILMLVQRHDGYHQPLDEVRESIRRELRQARRDAFLDGWRATLRRQADIEVDAALLERLAADRRQPPPPGPAWFRAAREAGRSQLDEWLMPTRPAPSALSAPGIETSDEDDNRDAMDNSLEDR